MLPDSSSCYWYTLVRSSFFFSIILELDQTLFPGPAAGFTAYMAKQPCPQDGKHGVGRFLAFSNPLSIGTDEEGLCEMINVYVTLASWVVPFCCKSNFLQS